MFLGQSWRSVASLSVIAMFVGSLALYSIAPAPGFPRVLDMGVAPAYLEPIKPYPVTVVLLESTVQIPTADAQAAVVFASGLATIRVSAGQYELFLEAHPAGRARLPAYSDLGNLVPGQTIISDPKSGVSPFLIRQLLEAGSANVIDERLGVQAEVIVVRETAYVCGPVCGNTEFTAEFLDGEIFFRILTGHF